MKKMFDDQFGSSFSRQLFQQSSVHISVIDPEYHVVMSNDAAQEDFGESMDRCCYEIYKQRKTPCVNCKAKQVLSDGKPCELQETRIDDDGQKRCYTVHLAPLFDDNGKITHIVEMSYDITKTKCLEERYNSLFESVPCAISVIDSDLRIVRANRMLQETYGEVENGYCYEVYKDRSSACPFCPALKTFEDGEAHSSKQKGITKNGDPTHYIVSTMPLRDESGGFSEVIEMSIDVTEMHELTQRLVQENAFRHTITEGLLDALVAVDEEGMVRVFNPAAEALFGMRASDVVGKESFTRFFPDSFRKALVDGGDSMVIPETTVLNANGEDIPVRVSGSILRDEHGVVVGGAASLQDLREIKRLEREKLERERLAAVGQTVAVIAHAIKNILVGIQGGMYKLKSGRRKESEQLIEHGLEMLDRNFERVANLVRGLLDLSRAKTPNMQKIKPSNIAGELNNLFSDSAAKENVALELDTDFEDEELPLDSEGIHTCLANLLSNAIDACKEDGRSGRKIRLTARVKDDSLLFETADNGPGIGPEQRERLFEIFFTTKGVNGSGLGLSVTQKIVQEHGGRIDVQQAPEGGALFRITLPLEKLYALWNNGGRHE